MITELQAEIFSLLDGKDSRLDVVIDGIEYNMDFVNKIGCYYSIKTINDFEYKDIVPLVITLVGTKDKKIEMQELATLLDGLVNKTFLSNARIVRQGQYYNSFLDDEGKENIVLSYFINKY